MNPKKCVCQKWQIIAHLTCNNHSTSDDLIALGPDDLFTAVCLCVWFFVVFYFSFLFASTPSSAVTMYGRTVCISVLFFTFLFSCPLVFSLQHHIVVVAVFNVKITTKKVLFTLSTVRTHKICIP